MKMGKTFFTFGAVLLMAFLVGCNSNKIYNMREKGNGNVISQERTANNFNAVILDGFGNVNVHHSENYKVVVTTDSNIQEIITIIANGNNLHIGEKKTNGINVTILEIDVYLPELKSISLNGVGNFKINNGNASELDISLSGAGNIDAQNFQVQNATIKHSGIGDVKISATNTLNNGNASELDISFSGAGNIDAQNFQVQNATIKHSGIGDVKISATNTLNDGNASELDISFSGAGNIDAQNFQVQNATIKHSGVGDAKIWATNTLNGSISGAGNILYKGNPAINVNRSSIVGKIKPV
jgi:hypothetical protein